MTLKWSIYYCKSIYLLQKLYRDFGCSSDLFSRELSFAIPVDQLPWIWKWWDRQGLLNGGLGLVGQNWCNDRWAGQSRNARPKLHAPPFSEAKLAKLRIPHQTSPLLLKLSPKLWHSPICIANKTLELKATWEYRYDMTRETGLLFGMVLLN